MKKVPVVKITTPDAAAELAGLPLEATVAMADVAAAMREGLLAFSTAAGLVVMQQMLTEELASIVGPKHAKLPDRVGNFHGTTTGQVVLGSQKITVARPRGRLRRWWRGRAGDVGVLRLRGPAAPGRRGADARRCRHPPPCRRHRTGRPDRRQGDVEVGGVAPVQGGHRSRAERPAGPRPERRWRRRC